MHDRTKGIPHAIESAIAGANPLVTAQNPEAR